VDPHVHFHVIPRYSEPRHWSRIAFPDEGWPGPPRLDAAIRLESEQLALLVTEATSNFR
jgi:diadenosine tetraphosphate (Ap4A) HIT family hydrolase